MSHHPLLTRWMARPWFFTLWCVLAAFGAYACMYGFRKPFTAAGFGGAETKAWLVTAQVIGYMLSKFIGIKVIAEMTTTGRARAFLRPHWHRASRAAAVCHRACTAGCRVFVFEWSRPRHDLRAGARFCGRPLHD